MYIYCRFDKNSIGYIFFLKPNKQIKNMETTITKLILYDKQRFQSNFDLLEYVFLSKRGTDHKNHPGKTGWFVSQNIKFLYDL